MQSKLLFFLVACSLVSLPAVAQIYKWVDDKGHVHYSDHPVESGKTKVENVNVDVNVVHSDTKFKFVPNKTQDRHKRKQQSDVTVVSSGKRKPVGAPSESCKAQWARYKRSQACYGACEKPTYRRWVNPSRQSPYGMDMSGCGKCEDLKKPNCSL